MDPIPWDARGLCLCALMGCLERLSSLEIPGKVFPVDTLLVPSLQLTALPDCTDGSQVLLVPSKGKMPLDPNGLMLSQILQADTGQLLSCALSLGTELFEGFPTWEPAGYGASIITAPHLGKCSPWGRAIPILAFQLLPAKAPGRNFSFPELDKLCTPGAGSVLALPCPWCRCIQPSPAPLQDPRTLVGGWDGAQGHCPLPGSSSSPWESSVALNRHHTPGVWTDKLLAHDFRALRSWAALKQSPEAMRRHFPYCWQCRDPWHQHIPAGALHSAMGKHSTGPCYVPSQQGNGINGKKLVLPSGGGEANALRFQEYPHSPRAGEKQCQSLCQTLRLWDSEGPALEPHWYRAPVPQSWVQWPGSTSSSLAGANQKLTHLRVTGQKKSEKTQQVKGNSGSCLCVCPQIAPAELLGSCLPAHPYLLSPPEALSVQKSHSMHSVGHI